MIFYDLFFRKFGIRRIDKLLSPVMPATRLLELPLNSIYHYLGSNTGVDVAPADNEYLFRNITMKIAMQHVIEPGSRLGPPQRHVVNMLAIIKQFHTRHRRYQMVTNIGAMENTPRTLVVENYGFIAQGLKYQRNILTPYYQWYNQQSAVWDRIAMLANESARHQFIKFQMPTTLPSMSDLKLAQAKMTSTTMHHLHEPEAFVLLEFWKWLGDYRTDSLLAKVPKDKLSKVNVIFEESGRWLMINLGLLDSWRNTTPAEIEKLGADEKPNRSGIEAVQLQRRFLKMMMTLFQARSVDGKIMQAEGDDGKKDAGSEQEEATLTKPDGTLPQVNPATGSASTATSDTEITTHPEDILNPVNDEKPVELHLSVDQERHLEADLLELDRISKAVAAKRKEMMEFMVEMDEEPVSAERGMHVGATAVTKVLAAPKKLPELKPIDPRPEENHTTVDHTKGVQKLVDRLAEQGMLSAAEKRRYQDLAKRHEVIDAPDGKGSLKDFVVVHPEAVKISAPAIPDKPSIFDKSMLHSSLHEFDPHYIENIMQKDVAAMVLKIQDAGYCVTDYEVEHVEQITGDFDMFTCRVTPVEGSPSTLRWKLPSIRNDGVYISNNVPYRMRKQVGDLPIRKIKPNMVSLTSYYGKVMVSRSEKKVNDYGDWIRRNIMAAGLDSDNTTVTNLQPAQVFDPQYLAPRMYTIVAQGFRSFAVTPLQWPEKVKFHTIQLNFDHTKREALFGKDVLARVEVQGAIMLGTTNTNDPVIMTKDGGISVVTPVKMINLPGLDELCGFDVMKAPDEFVEVKVLGQTIPLGVVLAYEMGLGPLITMLGVMPRRVPAGKRVNLEKSEYALQFADETLVFKKSDKLAALILSGFGEYWKACKQYSVYEFDKRGVYLNVLEASGIGARYLREIDLMYQMWVDPITRELLLEFHEPTDFQAILLRAADLLLSDQHPREKDTTYQRFKGYERMAGAVYAELIRSIRTHNGKPGKSKQPLDLNPFEVWKSISEDPSKQQVKDINPVENLKQQEAVTYSGTGGRNSRSMTKNTRGFDPNDMGVISESTVDSSDVGVNTYTSANPQFISVRGVTKRYEIGKTGATSLLSTSALLSVASDKDDPKRVNFIAIQQGHGVACHSYHANAVRTGYEQVIAHRTSDLFATTAKKPGKVIALTEYGLTVEYDDGKKQGIELGRRFGSAEGATIPHEVRAAVKLGQRLKVGDLIAYNEGFFEPDFLDPSQVVWKPGVTVKVALMESPLTLEDSSAISKKTAELLRSKTTKIREIIVDFKQTVHELVKVGAAVTSEDILCVIEDETTARNEVFNKESLDTLRILTAQTPQAKATGIVERIEVYYHGEKEDMSDSLRALASASDREFAARHRSVGRTVMTGQVDESYRSDGDSLLLDTMAIKVYITSDVSAGVGDKGVFANQMKTVFGHVLESEVTTESGLEVGAIFGAKSIQARIVHSPDQIGTTTTLLDVLAGRVVKAYRGK